MIKEIEFVNFKGHTGKITLASLNLITGENTAGKTTVLQALELALTGGVAGIGKQNAAVFQLASGPEMAVLVNGTDGSSLRKYTQAGKTVRAKTTSTGEVPKWAMLTAPAFVAASPAARLAMLAEHSGANWGVLERAASTAAAAVPAATIKRDRDMTAIEWSEGVVVVLKELINGEKAAKRQHEASLGSIAALVENDPKSPPPDTSAAMVEAERKLAAATQAVGRLDLLVDAGRDAAAALEQTVAEKPASPADYAQRMQKLTAEERAQIDKVDKVRALEQTRQELEAIAARAAKALSALSAQRPPARKVEGLDAIQDKMVKAIREEGLDAIRDKMTRNREEQRSLQEKAERFTAIGAPDWRALCQKAEQLMSDAKCIMHSVPDEAAREAWQSQYAAWGETFESAVNPRDEMGRLKAAHTQTLLEKLKVQLAELEADESTILFWDATDEYNAARSQLDAVAPGLSLTLAREELLRIRADQQALVTFLSRLEKAQREWQAREQLAAAVRAGEEAADKIGMAYDLEHCANAQFELAMKDHEAHALDRLRWQAALNRSDDLLRLREMADKCQQRADEWQAALTSLIETRDALFRAAYEPIIAILREVSGPVLQAEGFTLDPLTSQIGLWKDEQFAPFCALSGAEQLLAIACLQVALAGSVGDRVLILDEMSRLDEQHRSRFLSVVEQLHEAGALPQVIVIDLPAAAAGYSEKWTVHVRKTHPEMSDTPKIAEVRPFVFSENDELIPCSRVGCGAMTDTVWLTSEEYESLNPTAGAVEALRVMRGMGVALCCAHSPEENKRRKSL